MPKEPGGPPGTCPANTMWGSSAQRGRDFPKLAHLHLDVAATMTFYFMEPKWDHTQQGSPWQSCGLSGWLGVCGSAGWGGGRYLCEWCFLSLSFLRPPRGSPARHVTPHHALLQATSNQGSSLPTGRHHQASFLGGLWRKCEARGCFGE